jgi:hypothetical protein
MTQEMSAVNVCREFLKRIKRNTVSGCVINPTQRTLPRLAGTPNPGRHVQKSEEMIDKFTMPNLKSALK